VLIEQPIDSAWTLVSDQEPGGAMLANPIALPSTCRSTRRRFLTIEEERKLQQQIRLGVIVDATALIEYRNSRVTSPKVNRPRWRNWRSGLAARNELATQHAQAQSQITEVGSEQARIRQNMQQLR